MNDTAPLDPATAKNEDGYLWYDAAALPMAGKGWPEESRQYERFPMRAEGVIPEDPWDRSLAPSGCSYLFSSDAEFLKVRWIDYNGDWAVAEDRRNCPVLYTRHENKWRWLGTAKPLIQGERDHQLVNGTLRPGIRDHKLYLPLGRGLKLMEIGIPEKAFIKPGILPAMKPIVFYGTSINQGGSRPGCNHIQMIERDLDYPVINLGLSGSGKMEPEVVALVAELNAAVFVIDCLPNMVAEGVKANFKPGIRHLRQKHPDTPILIVESLIYQDAFLVIGREKRVTTSNAAQFQGYQELVDEGIEGLAYVKGDEIMRPDNDGTGDGTHPNALGARCYADKLGEVLSALLPDRK